jgi:hypothetical protein
MQFTRFQLLLLGVAVGLAALALGRVMAIELYWLKAAVFSGHYDAD